MLKIELLNLKQESRNLKFNPSLCDVSYDTNDLSDYGIEKCDFPEAESVCNEKFKKVSDKKFADFVFHDNNSIDLKNMERMGFKGKGLGKDEQRLRNLIETIVKPKYVGLGYDAGSGKMNKG